MSLYGRERVRVTCINYSLPNRSCNHNFWLKISVGREESNEEAIERIVNLSAVLPEIWKEAINGS